MQFAVIDIETTGLFHQGHGITEVAVVHVHGNKAELAFHSLVNPSRRIPKNVSFLTGITDRTTRDAPPFRDIAQALRDAIGDRIFVAHNVNFDYQFLRAAFQEAGLDFRPKRLCTMRLARKVVPGLKSYSLTSLCTHLNIVNQEAHRAGGDAFATSTAFQKLLALSSNKVVTQLLHSRSKNAVLPPSITKEKLDSIPKKPGVYYFVGQKRKPIYIGKSKNLNNRILSHFTSSGSSAKKQAFQRFIQDIKYVTTADDYEASLLEDAEIKKYWPRYNQAQKDRSRTYSVIHYTTRGGETRFGVSTSCEHHSSALASFHSLSASRNWLFRSLLDFGIDPRIGGFPENEEFLSQDVSESKANMKRFIESCTIKRKESFLLLGGTDSIRYAVAIINGAYKGFANSLESDEEDVELIKQQLNSAPDSLIARNVVRKMLADDSVKRLELE